jgi:hypothetical protein
MTAPTLWIEITMAGAVYVAAIWFAILGWLKLDPTQGPPNIKDFLPYFVVIHVGASYIVGITMHRVTQVTAPPILRMLKRVHVFRLIRAEVDLATSAHFVDLVTVWQYGSARLHRELDFQFALLALLRSLIFSLPLLGGAIAFWLNRTARKGVWESCFLLSFFWMLAIISYARQADLYQKIKTSAIDAAKALSKPKPAEPR